MQRKTANPYIPVVIIGAARSGTNMLRDVMTSLPGVKTWPCDEIPFLWRFGNARRVDDEFLPSDMRPEVQRYIQRAFDRIASPPGVTHVVEKTCANALRVEFVDAVLGDAKFVHLIRDGRDAVPSAMQRWRAALDLPYVARKARFVPKADIPYYAMRFAINRLRQVVSPSQQLGAWGPRFHGMEESVRSESLATVCAWQWRRCIENATRGLRRIGPDRVFELRYERFVASPSESLTQLGYFLGRDVSAAEARASTQRVSTSSIGKGWSGLADAQRAEVLAIIQDTLSQFDYRGQQPKGEPS